MSRVSRGCLSCRKRKVKCDEGRPSCKRCIQRSEPCVGYRDEATLVFRYENEKVERRVAAAAAAPRLRRRSSVGSLSSKPTSTLSGRSPASSLGSYDDFSFDDLANNFSAQTLSPAFAAECEESQAVSDFFEKFVMYPMNSSSTSGFLEHLPSMFVEVSPDNRFALRWAVRAAAYANLAKEHPRNEQLKEKAMTSYGKALSLLAESLRDLKAGEAPDDYLLMAVVVLDLFENLYLGDHPGSANGAHAEGMKQILRLRGPDIHDPRSWSLFQLSHHRIQRQQLVKTLIPMPEQDAWLSSIDSEAPAVQIERGNLEITKLQAKAKALRASMQSDSTDRVQLLAMVKEMHELDRKTVSWRKGEEWRFKTIPRAEVIMPPEDVEGNFIEKLPENIQLHRDVWIAYEWNYHRTARILLHTNLLTCLESAKSPSSENAQLDSDLQLLTRASTSIIQGLVDEILSTVPQTFGDIDSQGRRTDVAFAARCRALGAYFLLWPIKILKSSEAATTRQREVGVQVFERIRDYTGMRDTLGDLSCI